MTTPIQPENIDEYLKRLFPISRSIMGNGNRETLKILQELVPISIEEYPSKTKVQLVFFPDQSTPEPQKSRHS